MAIPFGHVSRLRQQLLVAIGSTGLVSGAALGCTTRHAIPDHDVAGARAGQGGSLPAGMGGASAGSGGMRADASIAGAGGRGAAGAGTGAGRDAMVPEPMRDAGAPMCNGGPSQRECFVRSQMESKAMFGCGQIPIAPEPTSEEVRAKFLPNGCLARQVSCDGCCNPAVAEGEPQADGSCCYTFCGGSCCGRPFRVSGEARLAGVVLRGDWSSGVAGAAPADRIGNEWLEDARMEHASIASFARFTLDLLAYAAPADLVELAQRAALDEVEHARLCFGLAARYSGVVRGPAPLATADVQVAPSLWDAAVAAFQDGCLGETLAALQAHAAFEQAVDPEVRRALERIAGDEARHAELAWRFVAWAMRRLGPAFGAEIQRVLAVYLQTPAGRCDEREPAPVRDALHAAGRLTDADKQRLTYTALREVVVPCAAALTRLAPEPTASDEQRV